MWQNTIFAVGSFLESMLPQGHGVQTIHPPAAAVEAKKVVDECAGMLKGNKDSATRRDVITYFQTWWDENFDHFMT